MTDDADRRLIVLIGGRRAGVVAMEAGRLSFVYDQVWRELRSATPLSLSMPLAHNDHGDAPVRAFLWGLLPDNERVLERWARDFQVSPRSPFALLRHVGEDCAGAAQFVRTDEHDLNEHLCLSAARVLGLRAASTHVGVFGAERAIVVERYDRRRASDGTVTRIHQEDMCQALGVPPTAKYQSDGGPTPERIIELLRNNVFASRSAATDVDRFVDALAFNWIIAGTDAHAKNYSILLNGPEVRLAPLYDVASALPYEGFHSPKLQMAMKVGGEYRVQAISGRHWRRFATANGLDPQKVIDRVDVLAERTPDAFAEVASTEAVQTLGSELPNRLVERLTVRAEDCRATLKL